MERLEFDLLFRWFVGLGMDQPVWDHSSFSKNRDRLLDGTSQPSSWRRCWPSRG
jgi:transposase